ncbi:ras-related protein rab-24 [Anaeramoeba flamelloides]|uniref:Ras-related protein rab-24 n=1 Tax=Anaeramoeba flamelloides TaxID=1746091 RepID=A0AAV7ZQK3_9EUKA|nr:ras-related protein rab-24 [Anaeramoeba flamelloides]KAJ6252285.1 ras-related protein rab-24 [Anaeramoeba flamelloides]
MTDQKCDYKIVLLGSSFTGKSCLIQRFIHNSFDENQKQTIGASFFIRTLEINNELVTVGIWDTAGQERFDSLTKMYYRGADAAIICYDIIDEQSFEKLKFWTKQLINNQPDCRVWFTGTKVDLLDSGYERAVSLEIVEEFSKSQIFKKQPIFETSSKTDINVKELFISCVTDLKESPIEKKEKKRKNDEKKKKNKLNLDEKDENKTCC